MPCACLWHCTYSAVLYFYLHRFNNTQTKANIFRMQHGPSMGAKFFIWCLAEEITICFHATGVWSHCMWELYWVITVYFIELQDSVCKNRGASCFKQDELRYRESSTAHFWEFQRLNVESSRSSRGQAVALSYRGVIRSPLLRVQCLSGTEEIPSESSPECKCTLDMSTHMTKTKAFGPQQIVSFPWAKLKRDGEAFLRILVWVSDQCI